MTGPPESQPDRAGTSSLPPPESRDRMMDILHAPLLTELVVVVAELGLADLVADGPRDVDDLAKQLDVTPDGLHRVLRALASYGVFREVAPRVYASTPLADTLRDAAPGSMRQWARLWGLPERRAALGALLHTVRTGQPAFEHLHGTTWWSHLDTHPDQAAVFRGAMGDLSRELHAAAVNGYDLTGVRRLVDVGGGTGQLVTLLLRRYPELTAVLFDQPAVVPHAHRLFTGAGVADRVEVVGGDFFEAVPANGDAYLLSMILHDWTDAQAVAVLTNVRRAMRPDGRVLVVDAVVPEDGSRHDGKLRDIIMLALHPGRERTEREFADLFHRAGLRLRETVAVSASTGLLVATPD